MGKTNYNKVEDSFDKGMEKIKRGWLLDKADEATGKKPKRNEKELTPKQTMLAVDYELKWLAKQDKEIYKTLDIKKKEIERLLSLFKEPGEISEADLVEIKRLRTLLQDHKKKQESEEAGGKQIEGERAQHIYKRHNIKENWIPLDTHADWNKHEKKKD